MPASKVADCFGSMAGPSSLPDRRITLYPQRRGSVPAGLRRTGSSSIRQPSGWCWLLRSLLMLLVARQRCGIVQETMFKS
eukprot:6186267-Pleurochrysis_carterae.AAC.5